MLYKIVERNNNKGECGERLHALNDPTNCSLVSSTGWKMSNSVYERHIDRVARSLYFHDGFYVGTIDLVLPRVDLILKNFLRVIRPCTFIFFFYQFRRSCLLRVF